MKRLWREVVAFFLDQNDTAFDPVFVIILVFVLVIIFAM